MIASELLTVLLALIAIATITSGCDRAEQPGDETELAKAETSTAMVVVSPSFMNGQRIPDKHTVNGPDFSPELEFSDLPIGTKELALICDDPDAPRPEPWVHWVIYKIPPTAAGLAEGIPSSEKLAKPEGVLQGLNSSGALGYRGPAPPPGHGTHHYHFKLYALDAELELQPRLDKAALLAAMQGHVIAETELIGTYSR